MGLRLARWVPTGRCPATNQGRIASQFHLIAYSGTYSLLLDDSVNDTIYSYAAAILAIDLSGQTQVELDFWWREYCRRKRSGRWGLHQ